MRPTWRKPFGILALLIAVLVYAFVASWLLAPIGRLPIMAQAGIYLVLGLVWLLPLRRFLIWMETGRWG